MSSILPQSPEGDLGAKQTDKAQKRNYEGTLKDEIDCQIILHVSKNNLQ